MTEWLRGNELEQRGAGGNLGGTMRLAHIRRICARVPASLKYMGDRTYRSATAIVTRSMPANRDRLEAKGCVSPGHRPTACCPRRGNSDHPWFIGVQYHPELKSRPFEPHPLFASFIEAAKARSRLV